MANENIYPKGIRTFKKHENAPDFVYGTIILDEEELINWLRGEANQYKTEYNGKQQVKLQATRAKDGSLSIKVDTWKPAQRGDKSNLPF
jgi:hypothetical protein